MIKTHVSVLGEAIYPHLNKPDVKFNIAIMFACLKNII